MPSQKGKTYKAPENSFDLSNTNLPKPKIDFFPGKPDFDNFPIREWRACIHRVVNRTIHRLTEYSDPAGLLSLREVISEHISNTRSILAEPDQIIITSGTQGALNLVARLFIKANSKGT